MYRQECIPSVVKGMDGVTRHHGEVSQPGGAGEAKMP